MLGVGVGRVLQDLLVQPRALHSTQIVLSLENRAFILSKNDPYKWISHNARLHERHTPPLPALKNALH
jgi:hypothetical protein